MPHRQVTSEVRAKIKQWEGTILFAYDDADPPSGRRKIEVGDRVRGTLTIGSGHTGPDVKPGMTITEGQADRLLDKDLDRFEAAVDRLVKVPLSDNQFGALVSFAFNVGIAAFERSTLLRKLNAGDYAAVPVELARWNKTTIAGNKVTSKGLANRRAAEAGLWASGEFVKSSGSEAEPTPEPISPLEWFTGIGTILGPAAGLATGTGPVQWAFGIALVIAAAVIASIVIKRQFFAK